MNQKLIFQLSLFGFVMAIATVYWIPSNVESWCWLAIFIASAYLIAKQCTGKYFLHGFLVSLANCVWVTSAHVIFYQAYIANHLEEVAMMSWMPMYPRTAMLVMGPVIGIVSGLVLGLFAVVASNLVKKK